MCELSPSGHGISKPKRHIDCKSNGNFANFREINTGGGTKGGLG